MSSSTKRRVQRLEAAARALGPIAVSASTQLPDDPTERRQLIDALLAIPGPRKVVGEYEASLSGSWLHIRDANPPRTTEEWLAAVHKRMAVAEGGS